MRFLSGPARDRHDEVAAEQALRRGLKVLGRRERELAEMPKGAPEKLVLVWWLREPTTVSLRWAAEWLKMGHYTRVTQALSGMRRSPGRKLKQWQGRLTKELGNGK